MTKVIAVLAVHPVSTAATRLRVQQYADHLAERDIRVDLWTFLREPDLRAFYGTSTLRRVAVVLRAVLRLPGVIPVISGSNAVLVQREALPLGPPLIEMVAARFRPMIWDIDDALWEGYVSPTAGRVPRWIRATGDKYRRICRSADEVWAGSDVLADWCRQHNDAVNVVPTVVSVPEELPAAPPADRVVGWIGSHSTGEFVEAVLPAIAKIHPPASVTIVGAEVDSPACLDVSTDPWTPEAEAQALQRMRVGMYPVDPTHPLAEGKCGLKAILYMAHGIPCVVTPTTPNARVVREGIDGLHAATPAEWTDAVQSLLDDPDLWQRCREAGYRRARTDYSLEMWAPRIAERLLDLARRGAP